MRSQWGGHQVAGLSSGYNRAASLKGTKDVLEYRPERACAFFALLARGILT
jgi:hypothetical protein